MQTEYNSDRGKLLEIVENVIASAIDDNYVWPFLVMVRSALSNSSRKFSVILGYDKSVLSDQNLSLISNVLKTWGLEIRFLEVQLDVEIEFDNYLTATTYARLLLADIIEMPFLWIDADVMCRKGWDDFFDVGRGSTGGWIIAGVQDPLVRSGIKKESLDNSAVISAGEQYFNAGVLLFHPGRWRGMNMNHLWRETQLKSTELGFQYHDQCLLNYLVSNSTLLVSSDLNYLVRSEDGRYVSEPKIVHFAGGFKPWHMPELAIWSLSPKAHRDLYREYAKYQHLVVIGLFSGSPKLSISLWRRRLSMRQTDSLLKILRQKLIWFFEGLRTKRTS